MPQLAEGTGTLVGATTHGYRRDTVRHRRPRSAGPTGDTPHSTGAPCPLSSLAPRDINIVLLTAQIKDCPRPPSHDDAFELKVTFCVRGVISPLLSNIYLHVLDTVWTRRHAQLGVLVRYADDFVVMCDTKAACEQAEQRVREVFARLGLELHLEKTRQVDLSRGREGFDFLGCHLRKRMSGPIWEQQHRRVYYLQRWPSQRAMQRVQQRVKTLTLRGACHRDLRETIAQLNPVLRGWGAYFRTGNAAIKFGQVDDYVFWRLKRLLVKRHGRHLHAGHAARWTPDFFQALGLHRLRGTIRYPKAA